MSVVLERPIFLGALPGEPGCNLQSPRAASVSYASVPFFFVPCRRSLAATCKVLENFHFLPGYLPSLRFASGSTGAQYMALQIKNLMKKSPFLEFVRVILAQGPC